jgi:hypothetical protein
VGRDVPPTTSTRLVKPRWLDTRALLPKSPAKACTRILRDGP